MGIAMPGEWIGRADGYIITRFRSQGDSVTKLTMSCGRCDRRWESTSQAHCSACHRQFSTTGNFDAHREKGKCKAPSRLGMKTVERAGGKVWVRKVDELEEAA